MSYAQLLFKDRGSHSFAAEICALLNSARGTKKISMAPVNIQDDPSGQVCNYVLLIIFWHFKYQPNFARVVGLALGWWSFQNQQNTVSS